MLLLKKSRKLTEPSPKNSILMLTPWERITRYDQFVYPDIQADAQKFRDVVEAYQVLSIVESRTAYDIQNQSVPDSIFKSQRQAKA
jgi:curved DNA-binding protein CbpA